MQSKPITNESGNTYWTAPNGEWHREDGPAIEFADGVKSFYLNDIYYTEEQYWEEIKSRGLLRLEKEEKVSRFKRLEIRK